jgi:hypothetical protein
MYKINSPVTSVTEERGDEPEAASEPSELKGAPAIGIGRPRSRHRKRASERREGGETQRESKSEGHSGGNQGLQPETE